MYGIDSLLAQVLSAEVVFDTSTADEDAVSHFANSCATCGIAPDIRNVNNLSSYRATIGPDQLDQELTIRQRTRQREIDSG